MSFLDKTFCASPNCQNKCSRKMTHEEKKMLDTINEELKFKIQRRMTGMDSSNEPLSMIPVSYAYFCKVLNE